MNTKHTFPGRLMYTFHIMHLSYVKHLTKASAGLRYSCTARKSQTWWFSLEANKIKNAEGGVLPMSRVYANRIADGSLATFFSLVEATVFACLIHKALFFLVLLHLAVKHQMGTLLPSFHSVKRPFDVGQLLLHSTRRLFILCNFVAAIVSLAERKS